MVLPCLPTPGRKGARKLETSPPSVGSGGLVSGRGGSRGALRPPVALVEEALMLGGPTELVPSEAGREPLSPIDSDPGGKPGMPEVPMLGLLFGSFGEMAPGPSSCPG